MPAALANRPVGVQDDGDRSFQCGKLNLALAVSVSEIAERVARANWLAKINLLAFGTARPG